MAYSTMKRAPAIRSAVLLCCCLLTGLGTGCAMFPACPWCCKLHDPPPPKVNTVLAYWDNHVHVTSDPAHHGAPLRGLAGRVYLFSEDAKQAMDATGIIAVEMFDMTPVSTGGQPKKLADWKFDTDSLKQLKKKDMVGEGYTLFLPWENYRPDMTQVRLQLAYLPDKGTPNYTDPEIVSLRNEETPAMQNRQVVPANYLTNRN